MALALDTLRVICGLAAISSGVMFWLFTAEDVRRRSIRRWLSFQDVLVVLIGLAIIGSGILNFIGTWQ